MPRTDEATEFEGMHEIEIRQRIQSVRAGDFNGWAEGQMQLALDGDDAVTLLRGLAGDPDAAGEAIQIVTDQIAVIGSR